MKLESINSDQLKKMAMALNGATYDDAEGKAVLFLKTKLKTIAISKENLAKTFNEAIIGISDDVINELPEDIINFYNEFFVEEEGTGTEKVGEATGVERVGIEAEVGTVNTTSEAPVKAEKTAKVPKEKAPKVPKEPKPAKEPKVPKEKKAPKELSVFGHVVGSQAAIIDDLINLGDWISAEELSEKSGRSVLGSKGHVKHLITDRKLTIEEKEGKYKLIKQ